MSDVTMPELIVSLHKRITKDGKRIAELEAALAALGSRRCEGCAHVKHHAVGTSYAYRLCALGNSYGYDAALPDDFACNHWTARAEEGTK